MSNVLKQNNGSKEVVVEEVSAPDSAVQDVKGGSRGRIWRAIRGFFLEDEVPGKVKVVEPVVKPEVRPEVLSEDLLEKTKADLQNLYEFGKQDLDNGPDESFDGLKNLHIFYGFYKEMLHLIGEHFSKDLKFVKALNLYSKDLINEMPGGVYFSDGNIIREILDEYSGETNLLKMLLAELFVIDRARQIEEVLRYLKVLPKGYVNSQKIFDDLVEYCGDFDDRNHPILAEALGHKVPRRSVYRG